MEENALPGEVETFVVDHVPSVSHLDCLVRLARRQGEVVSAATLAERMVQKLEVIEAVVEDLVAGGLIVSAPGGYSVDGNGAYHREVTALVAVYDRFPVQLIRVIYEPRLKPKTTTEAAQSFADAFRLRKD